MKHKTVYTRRLRRSKASALVALFAMLFQILFAMEHASAMAVAAARGGADGSPMGFLDICTAEGLLRIPTPAGNENDEKPSPRSSGGESCSICGSAAVSGASENPTSGPIIPHPHRLLATIAPTAGIAPLLSSGFKRSGTTRGPPAC